MDYELELKNEQLENMITVYEKHIEELEQENKQLKNRYNDPTIFKRFVVGVDRAKMRLYDCEQQAQDDILDNKKDEEDNVEEKTPKKSFAEFKF